MAKILLVGLCLALIAVWLCRARDCLSHCCNLTEVNNAGHHLMSRVKGAGHPPMERSSVRCQAFSNGSESQRSISPWRYEKDEDDTRFPFRLWQARCSCSRCIALKPSLEPGKPRDEISPHGNSAIVMYNTIVFFRRQCGAEPGRFKLVPEVYPVNVSCTCVIPEKKTTTKAS